MSVIFLLLSLVFMVATVILVAFGAAFFMNGLVTFDGLLLVFGAGLLVAAVPSFLLTGYLDTQHDIVVHTSLNQWGSVVKVGRGEVRFADGRTCEYKKAPGVSYYVVAGSCDTPTTVPVNMEPKG